MAVTMTYGGYQFEPVPQLTLSVNHVRDDAGNLINIQHVANLNGKLVSLGRPNQGAADLFDQQNDLRAALADCGNCKRLYLECDGTVLLSASAQPRNLTFSPTSDNWVFTTDYSVEFYWNAVNDSILMAATGVDTSCLKCLTTTSESWDIQQLEPPAMYVPTGVCPTGIPQMLNITHTVSAKGYNCCLPSGQYLQGYQVAKQWVEDRIGFSTAILNDISGSTFRLDPNMFAAFNHNRQISINKSAGEYSVTETWTVIGDSGLKPYLEDYTVEQTTDQSNRFTTISIQGTINGLETRNSVHTLLTSKWQNAMIGWSAIEPQLYSRASCMATAATLRCPLNTSPISTSVSKNPTTGTVNYNYTYNSKVQLVSGSLSESVNVSDTMKSSNIVEVGVIGRRAGPILYDTRQNNKRQRNISISLLMNQPTGCYTAGTSCATFLPLYSSPPTSGVEALLCCLEQHLSGISYRYYKTSDTVSWNPTEGSYQRDVSYLWEPFCNSETSPGSFCG